MIARPAWERPLRRKLRKWRSRPEIPRWMKDHGVLIAMLAIAQCVMMIQAAALFVTGAGGIAASVFNGAIGGMLAMYLRARWWDRPWLIRWTPADMAIARRLQTREAMKPMVVTVGLALLFAAVASGFSPATGMGEATGAAALAIACGFLLAGGRTPVLLLGIGVLWCGGYAVLTGWLIYNHGELFERLLKGAVIGWMPLFPWLWSTHGSPFALVQAVLFTGALGFSMFEWRKSWLEGLEIPVEQEITALSTGGDAGDEDAVEIPEPEAVAEMHEDQRRSVRQHVAFAWFGMAGYLPEEPMPRLDRLLWRWLSPRERMLSCLGSQGAARWFGRTRWTAVALAVMVAGVWLPHGVSGMPAAATWLDEQGSWLFFVFLALGVVAVFAGVAGRWSRFQPWLDLMEAQGLGHFPTFALLPVTPGEWIRAAAKEWAVRSAWISSLWSIALAVGTPAVDPEIPVAWRIAFVLLPWGVHAAWFPLSVLHRLIRAVSGPAFASHGITRTMPALFSGLLGLVTLGGAFLTAGAKRYDLLAAFLLATCLFGAFSLWMTLWRCRSMRLDVKPAPLS